MTIKTKTSQSKKVRHLFRRMREGCGISVIEMAGRATVSPAKLHKWEQCQRKLTLKELYRLSEALDVLVDRSSKVPPLTYLGGKPPTPAQQHAYEQALQKLTPEQLQVFKGVLEKAAPGIVGAGAGLRERKERESFGITQLELAREMGESQSMISMMEGGYIKFNEEEAARHKAAMDKLKDRHAATARQILLFRDIVESLRRENAELQEQLDQHEQREGAERGE